MESEETERSRKKPGPRADPSLANMEKFTMKLDPEDAEWGKEQPGGLSVLVRRLLREARAQAAEVRETGKHETKQ